MIEAGLTIDERLVRRGSFAPEFAREQTVELVSDRVSPTALFASSDYLALGALRGLREAGVAVPTEMSFVSFDDTLIGDMLMPALTAIRQPITALGRHGFLALHALINCQPAAKLTRLPVELIKRESVAGPRSRGRLK